MQANNFLEFFPFRIPVFETAILAWKQKGENFRNAPSSIFDIQGESFICTKFEAFFTTFSLIVICIRGTNSSAVLTPPQSH